MIQNHSEISTFVRMVRVVRVVCVILDGCLSVFLEPQKREYMYFNVVNSYVRKISKFSL